MSKTYCWVHYSIRDGDTQYGSNEPVVIEGDFNPEDEKLWKLLLFKLIGEDEFGMEADEMEDATEKDGTTFQMTECGGYRIGEIEDIKVIPQADFDVLKNYMGWTEITNDFEEKVMLN